MRKSLLRYPLPISGFHTKGSVGARLQPVFGQPLLQWLWHPLLLRVGKKESRAAAHTGVRRRHHTQAPRLHHPVIGQPVDDGILLAALATEGERVEPSIATP